jgi:hypothetical protein
MLYGNFKQKYHAYFEKNKNSDYEQQVNFELVRYQSILATIDNFRTTGS